MDINGSSPIKLSVIPYVCVWSPPLNYSAGKSINWRENQFWRYGMIFSDNWPNSTCGLAIVVKDHDTPACYRDGIGVGT